MYINYRIQRTPTDSKNSHCRLPMANKLLNVYIIGDTIRVCTKTKQWTTSYICDRVSGRVGQYTMSADSGVRSPKH